MISSIIPVFLCKSITDGKTGGKMSYTLEATSMTTMSAGNKITTVMFPIGGNPNPTPYTTQTAEDVLKGYSGSVTITNMEKSVVTGYLFRAMSVSKLFGGDLVNSKRNESKLLYVGTSLEESLIIKRELNTNNIEYTSHIKSADTWFNFLVRLFIVGTGSLGMNGERVTNYSIYVNSSDYDKAKAIKDNLGIY